MGSNSLSRCEQVRFPEKLQLGKRLAEWPNTHQLFGELGKAPSPLGNKAKTEKKQHCFSYVEGQIRCTVCNFLPRKEVDSHKECEGFPKAIVEAIRHGQMREPRKDGPQRSGQQVQRSAD